MVYNIRFSVFVALFVTFSDAQWNTNDYMKREHSLVKPYQGNFFHHEFMMNQSIILSTYFSQLLKIGSGFGMPNWDFSGSTIVTSTHVRLTPNEQSQRGAIWNTQVRKRKIF